MPALVAVSALTLTACGGGGTSKAGTTGAQASASVQNFLPGTAADSVGPAPAIPGAVTGGTAHDIENSGFDYLDPSQQYVNNQQEVGSLYSRSLTGYKTDPATGKVTLVGDLATDIGTTSDGGKTWTWHLKDGLKFQDGTPITSKDVKYAVERLYEDYQTQGPVYFQTWLSGANYRTTYKGPSSGTDLPDSVISTPDDKTVTFHFQAAHTDASYAASMSNITAIEKSKDDGAKYNAHPQSIGPYMISNYQAGKTLTLVKNPMWDPKTDPIRHQYVDSWVFDLGIDNQLMTQRLMAGQGDDKYAVSMALNADGPSIKTIESDPQYASRTMNKFLPFVDTYDINMTRVTDLNVRKALATAFPVANVQKINGGNATGEIAGNLVSPTVAGWKDTDPLGIKANPAGDPAKAKAILQAAGKLNTTIVYAYSNTPTGQQVATAVSDALTQAGFNVQAKPLDTTSYYTQVGKADNGFDLYRTGWAADWPMASTVIPPTLDGRLISDGGNNYSHYNNPAMNSEMDRIGQITDINTQDAQWMQLADKILATDIPQIPTYYDKYFNVYGAGLGGVGYNQVLGTIDLNSIFVKK
ncbi:ABC transporter substrate-binding protein [Kitasatospora sp. GAS204B]|uniref:ABC transporter substrate-binding protein n=1 Tax=unclassified Kitasatospora TaxID=2633591 RepID=UPI002472F16F|nr:ABC transporter substrate-binding protein [Kitasatospora sp. GAS204B]MDH6116545.1 peptide/nickel transport system substrate-binding protein [Kitasatospora sp. GAS204B]